MGELPEDDPQRWLGGTPLLVLDDCKLRLKAHSLTQLCKNEREKALAIYGFVKRLTLAKPLKLSWRTAREVIEAGGGDADDKATVLVALLRAAGIPARLRYVELKGEMLQGLVPKMTRAARPLAEIWLGRWVRTDTYIFDAAYMAAARHRLRESGAEWGYGIHAGAQTIWNGADDAFLGGRPTEQDPMVLRSLCVVSDPLELVRSKVWRSDYGRLARALHWALIAPVMGRVIRELREEASAGMPVPARR